MNYSDIRELSLYRGTLSVSLCIVCNDRFGCINKITTLCLEAAHKVRERYDSPEGHALAKKLESLQSRIPVESHIQSVALFVNESIAWAYPLAYTVQDATYIDDHFVTDTIVRNLVRATRYWVLVLYHDKPFLFDGYDGTLLEIVHRHTTRTGEERVTLNDLAGRVCGANPAVWGRNCRYATKQEFVHHLDESLQHFIESDPLPIVCCGDTASIEAFRSYSEYADRILISLPLDRLYDREDLQVKVWSLVQRGYDHLRQEMLRNLQEACTAHLCVRGITSVWRALHEGRAQFICLEKKYEPSVCELRMSDDLTFSSTCRDGVIKNGIDVLLEVALRMGVPFCWYPASTLAQYSRVAAIVSSDEQETPISS